MEENQTVRPGAAIVTLADSKDIQVETGIPETLINQVKRGQEARARFDVIPNATFPARVTEIRVQTSETSTYKVTLDIEGADNRLRPGMVGEVMLTFRPQESAQFVTVPAISIVGEAGGKHFAWVVQSSGSNATEAATVERREVTPGQLTSKGLVIEAGLKPGELLVTRGVHRLSDGMKVKFLP